MLEIFSYIETRAARGELTTKRSYIQGLEIFSQKYRRYRGVFRLFETLTTLRRGSADLLFIGVRFSSLILSMVPKYKVRVVVQGQNDLLWCLRHAVTPIPAWAWRERLSEAYRAADAEVMATGNTEALLEEVVLDIAATLTSLKPRALVLENDSLFLERAFVLAARSLGIPSVTIQDGIFQKSAAPHILHGHFTDHMLVWGEFFRQMYIDKNILPEARVHVLGYPYPVKPVKAGLEGAPTVCFLGQPWERYDETLDEPKTAVIYHVTEACRALGLPLVYRLHPLERRHDALETLGVKVTDAGEGLEEAFAKYDIFFSINSTALVEAALRGRVAAQVLEARFPSDDFEALGICYSLENDADVLKAFLKRMKEDPTPFPPNPDYISLKENPREKLIEFLSALSRSAGR